MGTKHVIIIGAGFGGLYAAKKLLREGNNLKITIIDQRNYHLFQPLLYQVATAQLSPEDIAYPIREIFGKRKNITILKESVKFINLDKKLVNVKCGDLKYDKLIVSIGVTPDYFGKDEWRKYSPPLKTIENALEIRKRILDVFENAESESLHPCEQSKLNFVIIGGGPTGIELAGALAELSRYSLKNEFRKINPERAKIFLVEAGPAILPGFPEKLINNAVKSLGKLGVSIKTNSLVTNIQDNGIQIKSSEGVEFIESSVALWAAGVRAKIPDNFFITDKKIIFDKKGRVKVSGNLTIPNHRDVYVIGDFASFVDENNKPLPGTAPVAMQQGIFAAKHILQKTSGSFKYRNKGSLAVIGRNAAVADFGKLQFGGFFAWVLWVFVHIGYLIGFNNKLLVMIKWAWNYLIRKSTARIIYFTKNNN